MRLVVVVVHTVLLATFSVLSGQTSRASETSRVLDWRLEKDPSRVPCTAEEIAFVNAPEQAFLEKSYRFEPDFSGWKCESIGAPAFNGARVLFVYKPSVLDDGEAFTLIQPRGTTNVRLLPLGGGLSPLKDEGSWHSQAAMNAILQTAKYGQPDKIDWLALSLAYLTLHDDAPSLLDEHFAPGPGENFKAYTVPGILSELPTLASKHMLPTLTSRSVACNDCKWSVYHVHFYYRTQPVEPLRVVDLDFLLRQQTLRLNGASVQDYEVPGTKKRKRR